MTPSLFQPPGRADGHRRPPPLRPKASHKRATSDAAAVALCLCTIFACSLVHPARARFEPYELNGGLVAAVAGRDYALIASDTRLTDGGYQIRSRAHLRSRIWAAGPTPRLSLADDDGGGGGGAGTLRGAPPIEADGSVAVPAAEAEVPAILSSAGESSRTGGEIGDGSNGDADNGTEEESTAAAREPERRFRCVYRVPDASGLTFVGSSGCAADCEALKRVVRSELMSHALWLGGGYGGSTSGAASAASVAMALMQTLYSRRPFPYYSFCVLAGMDGGGGPNGAGTGRVNVYDAIGSHERVAVGSAGSPGREMLQPVLDRLFSSSSSASSTLIQRDGEEWEKAGGGSGGAVALRRDGRSVPAPSQRVGSLGLGPPVTTCVDCSAEEAVAMIVRAYRSVSEREIGVGDDVVVCVLRRDATPPEGGRGGVRGGTLEVMRFPLKKH